ncbi:DotU family type IV/VI secretion system protein [Candidatus Poribacteria bacterium]|nr:DotU family type IV/VI secretion system protein [Candidatus Poribacteria bacterium]
MTNPSENLESSLVTQFREFYYEVIRQKRWVQANPWGFSRERSPESGSNRAGVIDTVQQPLLSLLKQQEVDARQMGGDYGLRLYKEAEYVIASLADEIFLGLEWEGHHAWNANLLESQLFDSHDAGERLFQKLDKLLQDRDPAYTDLAHVYLMALALGFQGKFRDIDDAGQIDGYRRRLFAFIARRDPDLRDESKHLFPEAYACTLTEGHSGKLRDVRKWMGWLILAILAWFVVSSVLWFNVTSDIFGRGMTDLLDEIINLAK